MRFKNGWFLKGDCLEIMPRIPAGSVDMVLCDLPYGTTACSWDAVIPFAPLWAAYRRVRRPGAAIVLTADQPFTSVLGVSNLGELCYSWVWDKVGVTGHLNAKKRPLKRHEDVLVFCDTAPPYNPDMRTGKLRLKGGRKDKPDQVYGKNAGAAVMSDQYYPTSVIEISNAGAKADRVHPTQKPVALFEYFIRTYTNPGDLVLDNTAGSGTTAIAAIRAGRQFICIEQDEKYYAAACERVAREEDGNGTA